MKNLCEKIRVVGGVHIYFNLMLKSKKSEKNATYFKIYYTLKLDILKEKIFKKNDHFVLKNILKTKFIPSDKLDYILGPQCGQDSAGVGQGAASNCIGTELDGSARGHL